LNTRSIQSAIDTCAKGGGGIVYFPAGKYLSGTIFLKSYITIYLDAGAVLAGSKNLDDYPVTVSNVRSNTELLIPILLFTRMHEVLSKMTFLTRLKGILFFSNTI